jgi:hypothetical protein
MKQPVIFAVAIVALLGVVALATAKWGDAVPDSAPAAKQLREQFEAVEKAAGIEPDRHGCDTPRKFVQDATFYYACPIAAPQVDVLRTTLSARGWQAAPASAEAGYTFLKGALRSRLACDAAGTGCTFKLETAPRPPSP